MLGQTSTRNEDCCQTRSGGRTEGAGDGQTIKRLDYEGDRTHGAQLNFDPEVASNELKLQEDDARVVIFEEQVERTVQDTRK